MQIRSPGPPGSSAGPEPDRHVVDPAHGGQGETPLTTVRYEVPAAVLAWKIGLATVLALLALLALAGRHRLDLAVALVASTALTVVAVRDVMARERLTADPAGVVVVRGFAGRRHLSWSDIERVRVDTRTRFGSRSHLLEIDAGQEIYLFSRYDLGVDPEDAADALESIRAGEQPPP